jgi:hypothetical protein
VISSGEGTGDKASAPGSWEIIHCFPGVDKKGQVSPEKKKN